MESKFYVSCEAARLLKKKGYNNYNTVYDCSIEGNILLNQEPMHGEWIKDKDVYPCPTKAETIDWLESKGYRIIIIYDWIECKWYFKIINGSPTIMNITELEVSDSVFYETRLEAEDAAIIKALELILDKGE